MQKRIVIAAVLIAVATSALAAEFYVLQDPVTTKCNVERDKPDGKTLVMVGKGPYPTKEEAKAAKDGAPECESFYVVQDPITTKCNIEKEKPDGKTLVMVGTRAHATKEEAKATKDAATECQESF